MKLFIIPGFTESVKERPYQKLVRKGRSIGFDVVPVSIAWQRRTMTDHVNEFVSEHGADIKDQVVFGFSFGAMIAFITATTLQPKRLILTSLSPYFQEDLNNIKPSWRRIMGKRRLDNFRAYRFSEILRKVSCPIDAFVGSRESTMVRQRVQSLAHYKHASISVVDGAKHDLGDPAYMDALEKYISTFTK